VLEGLKVSRALGLCVACQWGSRRPLPRPCPATRLSAHPAPPAHSPLARAPHSLGAVAADLHRGHGGVGHGQHEVPDERVPHHRHHGRRQRGDCRGDRPRQHVHLRRVGRRGAGAAAAGVVVCAPALRACCSPARWPAAGRPPNREPRPPHPWRRFLLTPVPGAPRPPPPPGAAAARGAALLPAGRALQPCGAARAQRRVRMVRGRARAPPRRCWLASGRRRCRRRLLPLPASCPAPSQPQSRPPPPPTPHTPGRTTLRPSWTPSPPVSAAAPRRAAAAPRPVPRARRPEHLAMCCACHPCPPPRPALPRPTPPLPTPPSPHPSHPSPRFNPPPPPTHPQKAATTTCWPTTSRPTSRPRRTSTRTTRTLPSGRARASCRRPARVGGGAWGREGDEMPGPSESAAAAAAAAALSAPRPRLPAGRESALLSLPSPPSDPPPASSPPPPPRQVLHGPHHPGVRRRHLARQAMRGAAPQRVSAPPAAAPPAARAPGAAPLPRVRLARRRFRAAPRALRYRAAAWLASCVALLRPFASPDAFVPSCPVARPAARAPPATARAARMRRRGLQVALFAPAWRIAHAPASPVCARICVPRAARAPLPQASGGAPHAIDSGGRCLADVSARQAIPLTNLSHRCDRPLTPCRGLTWGGEE
jgi:hypothetical protein